jgi:hypothetical protein
MVRPVIAVVAMLGAPSIVATTQSVDGCSTFSASRSFGDAGKNGTSAIDVILYPGQCVDNFRSK